jgi:hypothetical protein
LKQDRKQLIHFTFRPVEIAALRSILVNYALQPDHVEVWEDVLSGDSVTLGELMSKLMPK